MQWYLINSALVGHWCASGWWAATSGGSTWFSQNPQSCRSGPWPRSTSKTPWASLPATRRQVWVWAPKSSLSPSVNWCCLWDRREANIGPVSPSSSHIYPLHTEVFIQVTKTQDVDEKTGTRRVLGSTVAARWLWARFWRPGFVGTSLYKPL